MMASGRPGCRPMKPRARNSPAAMRPADPQEELSERDARERPEDGVAALGLAAEAAPQAQSATETAQMISGRRAHWCTNLPLMASTTSGDSMLRGRGDGRGPARAHWRTLASRSEARSRAQATMVAIPSGTVTAGRYPISLWANVMSAEVWVASPAVGGP